MAYSDDLVEKAKSLAATDPRRPKQANIRRALSSAYYALFHEIVDRAARSILLGADAAGPIGSRLRRTIEHRAVLKCAKWFAGAGEMPVAIQAMRGAPGAGPPPIDASLSRLCQIFVDLQAERHRADYDLSAPFARADVNRRIIEAESAIAALRALETKGDALLFLLGCVMGDGLTRNPMGA